MQSASGTPCSSHHRTPATSASPVNSENFGTFQPWWCPHQAKPAKEARTIKVGIPRKIEMPMRDRKPRFGDAFGAFGTECCVDEAETGASKWAADSVVLEVVSLMIECRCKFIELGSCRPVYRRNLRKALMQIGRSVFLMRCCAARFSRNELAWNGFRNFVEVFSGRDHRAQKLRDVYREQKNQTGFR